MWRLLFPVRPYVNLPAPRTGLPRCCRPEFASGALKEPPGAGEAQWVKFPAPRQYARAGVPFGAPYEYTVRSLATAVAAGIVQAERHQILHPKMAHVAKRNWLAGRLLLLGHSVVLSMKEKAGWASDRVALNDRAVPRDGGVMLVTCWSGYAPKKERSREDCAQ